VYYFLRRFASIHFDWHLLDEKKFGALSNYAKCNPTSISFKMIKDAKDEIKKKRRDKLAEMDEEEKASFERTER